MFENALDRIAGCVASLTSDDVEGGCDGPELNELESRVCFSAVPVVGDLAAVAISNEPLVEASQAITLEAESADSASVADSEFANQADESLELIIIDAGVPDKEGLIGEFVELGMDPSQIFILDADRDGIQQVTEILQGFDDVSAVHVISHGESGSFQLGSGEVNVDNVSSYAQQLTSWQQSLTADADLLLYGCDMASSHEGVELLEQLSLATGADVAGSDNTTGHESLAGDWVLEVATGTVDTLVPFGDGFAAGWTQTLAVGSAPALLFATDADVTTTNSNISGINDWQKDDAIAFADPGLQFESSGGMAGDYSVFIDGLTDTRKLKGLHIVESEVTLYGGSLVLQEGDVLFVTEDHTLGGLNVSKNDVVGFRPTVAGDYSSGTYFMVLTNPLGTELRGITLAEADTNVGGSMVQTGTFLLSRSGGSEDDDIWAYRDVGTGVSVSSLANLAGGDFGMGGQIHGLELIEHDVTIGGTTLESGQIIITWNGDEDLPGGGTATAADAFVIDLATTGNEPTGTAFQFFSGQNAEIAGEKVSAVALVNSLSAASVDATPTDLSSGIEINTDGGNDIYLYDTDGYNWMTGNAQVTMEYRFSGLETPVDWTTLYSVAKDSSPGDHLAIHADGTLDWNGYTTTSKHLQLFDGDIHSVAMAIDLTGGGTNFYVDGVFVETVATPVYGGPATGNADFVLGQYQGAGLSNFDADRAFSGTFHDVRVWNDIRSATEIAENYDRKFESSDLPANLQVNWQMTELTGAGNNQIVDIVDPGANITLEVRHVGEAGFSASTASDSLTIVENSINGASVGFVMPHDADSSAGSFSYTLGSNAGGRFTIDGTTGEITVANATLFNFEAGSNSQTITVQVSDGTSSYSESIAIQITDVNEAPVASYGTTMTVTRGTNANVWNTSNLTFTDPDASDASDQLTYRLTSGPSHGMLLNGGSILNIGDEFTVEDVELGGLTYDHNGDAASTDAITFELRDGGEDGVAAQSVTLNINVTGTAPVANDESYTIDENTTLQTHPTWWDSDWSLRRELTFDNSASTSNLTNYPVLVTLDASNIDYSQTQNTGEDLRFVDSNGTVLDYEIEVWNESGVSTVWVEVPQIDTGSTTDSILMYYGNSTASA
ncbi:MAG: DUF2341 domain-containing protein, partial [Planctomycetota bacterium]